MDYIFRKSVFGQHHRLGAGRILTYFCVDAVLSGKEDNQCLHDRRNYETGASLGNKKVNKMLKELEEHGLIYRRHQGLGRPNKIYVYDLLKADNSNWLPKQIMFGKGSSNEKEVL